MNVTLTDDGYTLNGKWRLVPSEYMESLTIPSPPQSLSPWQPISTAPKDGTDILIMTGETMHVVRWKNVHGDFDYWVVDDNKHGPFTLRGKEPTHWIPLPEPAP